MKRQLVIAVGAALLLGGVALATAQNNNDKDHHPCPTKSPVFLDEGGKGGKGDRDCKPSPSPSPSPSVSVSPVPSPAVTNVTNNTTVENPAPATTGLPDVGGSGRQNP
jgi:hypothetical protein